MNKTAKYLFPLICIAILGYGCTAFKKLGMNMGEGLKKSLKKLPIDTASVANASRAATSAALEEVLKESVGIRLQEQLDPILSQLIDSLDIASKQLAGNITTGITDPKTEAWLRAQTDLLTQQLLSAVSGLRTELLGENSKEMAQAFIRDAVISELDAFFARLLSNLAKDENLDNLTTVRQKLSVELDSLLAQSLFTASTQFDKNFSPKVDAYVEKFKGVTGDTGERVDETISTTQRGIRGIIGLILGGSAGLILLWGLLRYYFSTRRYKDIIKVLTKQIDEIGSQTEYDKLVEKVKNTVEARGLSDDLEEILKEQKLDEQPEWEDKDQQVLKLITKYLKAREADANTRTIAEADPLTTIYEEAKDLGLDDHLKSMIDRTA